MDNKFQVINLETPVGAKIIKPPFDTKGNPFEITLYGYTETDMPCYILRMNSPFSCMQYVRSGGGVIISDGKIFTVQKGDTFLVREGANQIYYSNPDNDFARVWINFKGKLSRDIMSAYGVDDCVVFRGANTEKFFDEWFAAAGAKTKTEYENLTARTFLEAVQFLTAYAATGAPIATPPEQIRLYIDCHIMDDISIADLARQFFFSQEHVIRTFRATYGITPHQYIIQSKIRIAMIMLRFSSDSISVIAARLNFSDAHHFSALFKKSLGVSPTEYRNGKS